MSNLELKIPPGAVGFIAAGMMWACRFAFPSWTVEIPGGRVIASMMALLGAGVILAAGLALHRAKTTINPLKPEAASSLVVVGVYRYTRNPIYLGLALILLGWGIYLSNLPALMVAPGFVWYMTRFQIRPEERRLEALFGEEFRGYRGKVRRWM